MNCPRCNGELRPEFYEGVEIDRCSGCRGAWLDEGELSKVVSTAEEQFSTALIQETLATAFPGVPPDERRTRGRCPKCQAAMAAVNYDYTSGVIINRCPEGHGVWMDKSELEKVQAHREYWEQGAAEHREEWRALARALEDDRNQAADENRRREMRPTRYLVNTLIRKLLGA
jgi:Zn-finger nucleic acid-binding protein